MKRLYKHSENYFEKIATFATIILGNSITFMMALGLVGFWLSNKHFYTQDIFDSIRDVMHAVIFLTLFIIQKSFNRFTGAIHLKINELILSHEPASNIVINAEGKTEQEVIELTKEYIEMAESAKDAEKD